MLLRSFWSGALFALLSLAFVTAPAGATVIGLSEMSSEQEEGGTPPDALLANLEFVVTGSTLELTVDNTFANAYGNDYNISEVFFNATADITSLSLASPPTDPGWQLLTNKKPWGPNSNSFDYQVSVAPPIDQSTALVLAGTTQTLTFDFTCAGGASCGMDDFVVDNDFGKAVAAKFIRGGEFFDEAFPGGDDSAFGASGEGFPPVPEPGTALLVGGGLLGLAYAGRRRAA